MVRFGPYILKSLWRHRTRSLLTVSGAAVALFVFSFVGSIQQGLQRLTHADDAQRTLIVFQENRFCPTTSRLPQDYAARITRIPGVQGVLPLQVWTNNCRASLDIVVFNGVPARELRAARRLELIAGDWNSLAQRRDAALVGRNVARRRNLAIGQQFSIGDISVQVVGVFRSETPAEENLIYTNLEFLQYTRGLNAAGRVTLFEVRVTPDAHPDSIARSIDEQFRGGPVATTTRRKGAFQASTLSDLVDLIGFAHWLGYACVALVLSIVATTMVMAVQDRIREHAVLQTLGLRPFRVFQLIVAESVILCLLGGLAGTGLALAALTWSGLAVGAEGVTIAFQPSWGLAAMGFLVSFAVGLLAGAWPAVQAARAHIVTSLRHP